MMRSFNSMVGNCKGRRGQKGEDRGGGWLDMRGWQGGDENGREKGGEKEALKRIKNIPETRGTGLNNH